MFKKLVIKLWGFGCEFEFADLKVSEVILKFSKVTIILHKDGTWELGE